MPPLLNLKRNFIYANLHLVERAGMHLMSLILKFFANVIAREAEEDWRDRKGR
jgi:hypothetical protein